LWNKFGADIAYPPLLGAIIRANEGDTVERKSAPSKPNRFGIVTAAIVNASPTL